MALQVPRDKTPIPLDAAEKVDAIAHAPEHRRHAELDHDDLIRQLHRIVGLLHDDVRALGATGSASAMVPPRPEPGTGRASGTPTDRDLYHVAFFAMTRLVLSRTWEDIGLVDQVLCGQGFQRSYDECRGDLNAVLARSFQVARERYPWLYDAAGEYTWYAPSDAVLLDVLAALSRYDLSGLDCDVLGPVYEAYLDKNQRRAKGQYYTPRPLVGFLWDRVGFLAEEGRFLDKGQGVPIAAAPPHPNPLPEGEGSSRSAAPVIVDFSTGSGGFLVEAARRIRQSLVPSGLADVDMDALKLAMRAILEGLCGTEISAFACYLTEVNLLIQLTPIIAAMRRKEPHAPGFSEDHLLSVLHEDALRLHNQQQMTLMGLDAGATGSASAEVPQGATGSASADVSQGATGSASADEKPPCPKSCTGRASGTQADAKAAVFRRLKDLRSADYVCSNPPYVGEKGNKELFRRVLRTLPYWREFHQGKMDYLYWFIILGLSKLRPGGRLGYITTGYWHTADGASRLRRYVLDHAKILEMIDFGHARLFSDAPGQHNMVFVLERSGDERARRSNIPKLVQVKREFDGATPNERLQTLLDHIQQHIAIAPGASYDDPYVRIFWAPVEQGELSEQAWHIFHRGRTEAVLERLADSGLPLREVCEHIQGVVSGADRVTAQHLRLLPPEIIERHGIKQGDGIFVLSARELADLKLSDAEQSLAKRTYKNSQVARYAVDFGGGPQRFLLYVAHGGDLSQSAAPRLFAHLEKFQTVLERRRECRKLSGRTGRPSRAWFELHWHRSERVLKGEKIVTPRRSSANRFAYVGGPVEQASRLLRGTSEDAYATYENSDLAMLARRPRVREGLKYVLALLNSAALDFWCEHRGKKKGRMREYYQTPLERIPIRRIRFEPATEETAKLRFLEQLCKGLDAGAYGDALVAVRRALGQSQEDVVHDVLEFLADRMIGLTEQINEYNGCFGVRLARLARDAALPELKPNATDAAEIVHAVSDIRSRMAAAQSLIDEIVLDLYGVSEPADRELILAAG